MRAAQVKVRGVDERRRWELTMSGAKKRTSARCEMRLRVTIQCFKWEVQMKLNARGETERCNQAMIVRDRNERCTREVHMSCLLYTSDAADE